MLLETEAFQKVMNQECLDGSPKIAGRLGEIFWWADLLRNSLLFMNRNSGFQFLIFVFRTVVAKE